MVSKKLNSQILVKLPVSNVPRCFVNNAKTLGLKHVQSLDRCASSGPPDFARIIHHRKDYLLVQ